MLRLRWQKNRSNVRLLLSRLLSKKRQRQLRASNFRRPSSCRHRYRSRRSKRNRKRLFHRCLQRRRAFPRALRRKNRQRLPRPPGPVSYCPPRKLQLRSNPPLRLHHLQQRSQPRHRRRLPRPSCRPRNRTLRVKCHRLWRREFRRRCRSPRSRFPRFRRRSPRCSNA